MLLAHQSPVLSFSLYFTVAAGTIFGMEDHGLSTVRALAPIVQQLDNMVLRMTYALLSGLFLSFVFVVLALYSNKSKRLDSLFLVLAVGFLFFLLTLWCVGRST